MIVIDTATDNSHVVGIELVAEYKWSTVSNIILNATESKQMTFPEEITDQSRLGIDNRKVNK